MERINAEHPKTGKLQVAIVVQEGKHFYAKFSDGTKVLITTVQKVKKV